MDDPSKTFWDDPKMYVDDPGLESLLSLTDGELLSCEGQPQVQVQVAAAGASGRGCEKTRQKFAGTPQTADGKPILACEYPNCDKSYTKPSHLKVSLVSRSSVVFHGSFGEIRRGLRNGLDRLFITAPGGV